MSETYTIHYRPKGADACEPWHSHIEPIDLPEAVTDAIEDMNARLASDGVLELHITREGGQ